MQIQNKMNEITKLSEKLSVSKMKESATNTNGQSFGKTKKIKDSARPWRVEFNQLGYMPYMYPLERTHIVITHLNVPVVSGRLSEFARIHSLVAKWSDIVPNSIRFTTAEEIQLDIKLWQSQKPLGGIIVEAKRYSGDGLQAHRLKCLLFKSLTSKKPHFQDAKTNHSIENQKGDQKDKHSRFVDAMETIETATKLMCSRSTEDIISGLKLIHFLTDPKRVKNEISSHVSSIIWVGLDPYKMTMLHATEIIRNYALDCSNKVVHFWAISILGNVFIHQDKRAVLTYREMEIWSQIIPMLIEDMENFESNPHTACVSIRVLRALIVVRSHLHDNRRRRMFSEEEKDRLKANIGNVVAFGMEQNANIEIEARRLIATLLK
jgi:hypothetical protein